jgi:hypothetical protein
MITYSECQTVPSRISVYPLAKVEDIDCFEQNRCTLPAPSITIMILVLNRYSYWFSAINPTCLSYTFIARTNWKKCPQFPVYSYHRPTRCTFPTITAGKLQQICFSKLFLYVETINSTITVISVYDTL